MPTIAMIVSSVSGIFHEALCTSFSGSNVLFKSWYAYAMHRRLLVAISLMTSFRFQTCESDPSNNFKISKNATFKEQTISGPTVALISL